MAVNLRTSRLAPWAGLIAGMVAEIVHHQLLSDMLRYDCRLGTGNAGLLVGLPALALIGFGAWVSWASTRGGDPALPHHQTRRFVSTVALMVAALLSVGIVWQILATLLVPACAP